MFNRVFVSADDAVVGRGLIPLTADGWSVGDERHDINHGRYTRPVLIRYAAEEGRCAS